jgi:hypothetical protein
VTEAPQRWRAIFMIADSSTPTFHKRVARVRARIVRELEAALHQSCPSDQHSDPELLAHHLLAVLWEAGRLLLVSPEDFTHERLLRSLDVMFTAIAAQHVSWTALPTSQGPDGSTGDGGVPPASITSPAARQRSSR